MPPRPEGAFGALLATAAEELVACAVSGQPHELDLRFGVAGRRAARAGAGAARRHRVAGRVAPMTAPRVLFLGGTGIISSACSAARGRAGPRPLRAEPGDDLHPQPSARGAPPHGRRGRPVIDQDAIGDRDFDVVVDWLAFTPDQVRARTDLFRGRVGQYVFISSASAYQTPPSRLPITESTPLRNPYWAYSRGKIACEDLLTALYREEGYPMTVVRPSHTYDETHVPLEGGWTAVDRMRRGEPVVVHGDGTSLWTLTHHTDFARDFVPLLGNPRTLGEAFHITSDDVLTWDQIARGPRRRRGSGTAHRARPVGRHRGRRRRLGRRAARRQGALRGLRQQQDPQPRPGPGRPPSASRRAPARSWPGTMPTRPAEGWTHRVDGLMSLLAERFSA